MVNEQGGAVVAHNLHRGDHAMHCGVTYKVAGIYKGEAELTTLSGVFVEYVPVHALHKVAKIEPNQHHAMPYKLRSAPPR